MDQTDNSQILRVLYVAEAFGGGLFEITRMQAEGLARAGHDVAIAYGRRPETPADVSAAVDPIVGLFALPWNERTIRAQVQAGRALAKVIEQFHPDVIHLESSFAGFVGALLVGRRLPTVYSPQGYAFTMMNVPRWKRAIYRVAEHLIARRLTIVGACSENEGDWARKAAWAPRIRVVQNGIEELNDRALSETKTVALEARESSVIALGRASPQRQPEACARILSQVSDRASVMWAGGGADESALLALAAADVPVTGWLPRSALLSQLETSLVYLHWTAWDGLPLSILEALARDVIVVASDIGPNREVLGAEQVFDSEGDAAAFIRRLLDEPELRGEVLKRQQARRRHFSADRMVADWEALYRELASTSRSIASTSSDHVTEAAGRR